MPKNKHYYCSNCKEIIISDDAGDGIRFQKDEEIYCKKRNSLQGSLHYHNIAQMERAILDTVRGDNNGREIRSYGKEAIVIYK